MTSYYNWRYAKLLGNNQNDWISTMSASLDALVFTVILSTSVTFNQMLNSQQVAVLKNKGIFQNVSLVSDNVTFYSLFYIPHSITPDRDTGFQVIKAPPRHVVGTQAETFPTGTYKKQTDFFIFTMIIQANTHSFYKNVRSILIHILDAFPSARSATIAMYYFCFTTEGWYSKPCTRGPEEGLQLFHQLQKGIQLSVA